ncbi:hypothetical protein FRB94_006815 [Tulasnella sp. JGI-2019a]|nr:hypothetical protein FRB93_010372 [Tulasnella sp. JGI-2019a]KAG9012015.1 hypothetical protein FRB94_006815 [Tulasnella sp. JGI-2019a]
MVLDYQSDTGPRLSCRFSMGDYNGKPNFLLKSPTGLLWKNLPPDLEALVNMPNMYSAVRNFALGPRGLYWYTYQSVNDVIEQRGSSNVWSVLAEDWKGGCPLRVTFGSDGYFWGEKEWMEPSTGGHLVQAFGKHPPELTSESSRLHPTLKSYEINFVAFGKGGSSWIVGTQLGGPFWAGIPKKLQETVEREIAAGQSIVNIVLSPIRSDIYWIEYWDGSVDFSLPSDWDLNTIGGHIMQHVNARVSIRRSQFDVPSSPSSTTSLTQLYPQDTLYDFVLAEFAKGWKHPNKQPAPRVHYIYEIALPTTLRATFVNYLTMVEAKRKHAASGLPKGNQTFGWHGTRRICGLGDNPSALYTCSNNGCATCCILNASFDQNHAGHAPGRNFLRFGRAIYTSSASSKSDDYQVSSGSAYRSLILARIVKGKSLKMTRGNKTLSATPAGYDSVEGVVGEELNYDETCLYTKDSIRPAFLVLYR